MRWHKRLDRHAGGGSVPALGTRLCRACSRRFVRHVAPHELVKTRNREVEMTVILGRVDQAAIEKLLADCGECGRCASHRLSDGTGLIRADAQLGHSA